jgi:hypothetical protein
VAHVALDSFVAEIEGAPLAVTKGDVFADSHPVVKLDDGRGVLFKPLDVDDGRPARAAKAPAAKTAKDGS